MAEIIVSATAVVQAAPEVVYGIFTDYHDAHPRVLPKRAFGALVVERGGTGAGTVFTVELRQGPRTKVLRMEVTEPQPGRVLMEKDVDSDMVTTFTVEPADGGRDARVTITTRWTRAGIAGLVERLIAPPLMRPVFLEEIRNVEQLARERAGAARA
ncbi:MAG TPA: SRPBCC family protein [Longimicrobium sp.]|nr:SRPBCC family protein [Longimicrobium sp.]